MDTLPVEILENIFDRLSYTDKLNCLLVNQLWHDIIIQRTLFDGGIVTTEDELLALKGSIMDVSMYGYTGNALHLSDDMLAGPRKYKKLGIYNVHFVMEPGENVEETNYGRTRRLLMQHKDSLEEILIIQNIDSPDSREFIYDYIELIQSIKFKKKMIVSFLRTDIIYFLHIPHYPPRMLCGKSKEKVFDNFELYRVHSVLHKELMGYILAMHKSPYHSYGIKWKLIFPRDETQDAQTRDVGLDDDDDDDEEEAARFHLDFSDLYDGYEVEPVDEGEDEGYDEYSTIDEPLALHFLGFWKIKL